MESKKAWDDVGESVGGLGKSLSKRFRKTEPEAEAEGPVTDDQLKGEAKQAGRSLLGALSATADEVSNAISSAIDGGGSATPPPPPGTSPAGPDGATPPPAPPGPAGADGSSVMPPPAGPSGAGGSSAVPPPAGPTGGGTVPPPAGPPGSGTVSPPAGPGDSVDPTTLPPPSVDEPPEEDRP